MKLLTKLKNGRKTFTLIELLVVIAIIAILAGMLLPALNNARESGRKSDCLSKQKQIGMMGHFYSRDYDDFLLPVARVTSSAQAIIDCWSNLLNPYIPGNTSDPHNKERFFICPSVVPEDGRTNDGIFFVKHHKSVHLSRNAYALYLLSLKAAKQLG